jgi:hypothetical protein
VLSAGSKQTFHSIPSSVARKRTLEQNDSKSRQAFSSVLDGLSVRRYAVAIVVDMAIMAIATTSSISVKRQLLLLLRECGRRHCT